MGKKERKKKKEKKKKLKSAFCKEVRNVVNSELSGWCSNELYVPNVWYYEFGVSNRQEIVQKKGN